MLEYHYHDRINSILHPCNNSRSSAIMHSIAHRTHLIHHHLSLMIPFLLICSGLLGVLGDHLVPLHLEVGGEGDSPSNRGDSSYSHRDWLSGFIQTRELEPIKDAKVLLETQRGHRVTYSNEDGFYSIVTLDLTNETSLITVSRQGYQTHEGEVFIENHTLLNITLVIEEQDAAAGLLGSGPSTGILLGAVLTILSFLFLSGERRYSLLSFTTAPLYTKLDRDDVLSHGTRREIYQYLVDNPGSNYVQIRNELDVGTSSMVHHLRVLKREGFICTRKELGRRLFFKKGAAIDQYMGTGSRQPSVIQSSILSYIGDQGPVKCGTIIKDLDLSHSTALHSLSRLRERGLITSCKVGKNVWYSLSDGDRGSQ